MRKSRISPSISGIVGNNNRTFLQLKIGFVVIGKVIFLKAEIIYTHSKLNVY